MRTERILDAMTYIDESLILRAEQPSTGKKTARRLKGFAAAACAVLMLSAGSVAAYSAGLFDGVLQYFGGAAEDYLEQILAEDIYAADGHIEMQVHGVTASETHVSLLVSLNGITTQGKEYIDDMERVPTDSIALFTKNPDGSLTKCSSVSIGTFMETSFNGTQAKSKLEGVQLAFTVDCETGADSVVLCFEDLTTEIDISTRRFETLELKPENIEISTVSDVKMSAVDFSFTVEADSLRRVTVKLILADGTLYDGMGEKIGYVSAAGYSEDDSFISVTGKWCEGSPVNSAVLDLEDFCGLEINGERFYYR